MVRVNSGCPFLTLPEITPYHVFVHLYRGVYINLGEKAEVRNMCCFSCEHSFCAVSSFGNLAGAPVCMCLACCVASQGRPFSSMMDLPLAGQLSCERCSR